MNLLIGIVASGQRRLALPRLSSMAAARFLHGRRLLPSPRPLSRLLPRLRLHVAALAGTLVALVLATGVSLAFPVLVQRLVDAALQSGNRERLDRLAMLLLALFVGQGLMNFTQVYLLGVTAERVIAKLREDLFAHLVHLSPGFFTDRRTGELTSRLTVDLTLLQTALGTSLSDLARQSLLLVGSVGLLVVIDRRLAVTALALVPLVVGTGLVFGRMLRAASTGVQDRLAEATASADEALGQVRTVQSFTCEDAEVRRYGRLLSSTVTAAIARVRLRATFIGLVGVVAFAAVVVVLWQGGRLVLAGTLSTGMLISFLLYAIMVSSAIGSLAALFGSYQEAVGAARRVFDLLDMPSAVAEPKRPVALPRPVRGDVRLEHVTFAYAPDLPQVLRDVSLHIAAGKVVALVGPSGVGKTTIASLIPRYWDVQQGRIRLDGIDVRDLRLRDLRGTIGIVPQEPVLFSGTVRDNIVYARLGTDHPQPGDEEVLAAARAAHAVEFIERLPEGLDTRVGERGIKLSGGQRQRLAIARVFLKNPAVVILDEATSSLDTESEHLVEQAMRDLLTHRSTLIIAHRLSTVLRADHVLVLDDGRIVEEGTHDYLLASGGVYARLHQAQFGNRRGSTADSERDDHRSTGTRVGTR